MNRLLRLVAPFRLYLIGGVCLLLGFALVIEFRSYRMESAATFSPSEISSPSDATHSPWYVVVFVGGEHRIQQGVELFHRVEADKLFISGVQNAAAQEYVLQLLDGVTDETRQCCITIDANSTNTVENAEKTAAWLENQISGQGAKPARVVLVTSPHHLPRAHMLLARATKHQYDIRNWPAPYPGELNVLDGVISTGNEFGKYLLQKYVL